MMKSNTNIIIAISFVIAIIASYLLSGNDSTVTQEDIDNKNNEILLNCMKSYSETGSTVRQKAVNKNKYYYEHCVKKLVSDLSQGGSTVHADGEDTLRSFLNLSTCRYIPSNHKLPKYNLEWNGYDIACVRGEAFNVYTPIKGVWIVEKIGYGNNLGNFIILKEKGNDFRIVYGHTKVTLHKEGDELNSSVMVGITDLSGSSTGVHVHVELWKGNSNVTYGFVLDKQYDTAKDSVRLLKHRNWNFSEDYLSYVVEKVQKLECPEGYSLKAYPDTPSKYSIGCGTNSFEGEVITEQQAIDRLRDQVKWRYERVLKKFPDHNPNQLAALTSLYFNNPECYIYFEQKGIDMGVWKDKCNKVNGEVWRGLQKRRDNEINLYNS